MGADDKIKATAEKASGKVKETVGKATGDDEVVAEGKAEHAKGSMRGAAEDVKDAFKK